MLWDTVFAGSEEMKALKPIFLELMNRIVTVICNRGLTGRVCVLTMKSDCNGKGDSPWAGNKNIRSTRNVPNN